MSRSYEAKLKAIRAEMGRSVTIPMDEEMRRAVRDDIDYKLRSIDEWLRDRGYSPAERTIMYRKSLRGLLPDPVSLRQFKRVIKVLQRTPVCKGRVVDTREMYKLYLEKEG